MNAIFVTSTISFFFGMITMLVLMVMVMYLSNKEDL